MEEKGGMCLCYADISLQTAALRSDAWRSSAEAASQWLVALKDALRGSLFHAATSALLNGTCAGRLCSSHMHLCGKSPNDSTDA